MIKNILIPLIVIILAIASLDPFMVLMPESMVYGLLVLLFISFVIYTSFVWHEHANDEREEVHRALAGRIAYIAGTTTLVTGIIYQIYYIHHVDPFLVIALSVMAITKYFGIFYTEKFY